MSVTLLERISRGDGDAVAECVERYGNLVWSLARRFTSNRSDAEDAVQDVFIELWSNASRFDAEKASETTFIAMIARRRLIDRLRKSKREPRQEELDAAIDIGEPDLSADLEIREEAERASRMIRTLKPEQQRVIKLSVYDGFSHQIIADKLGMPLGTVKTHLRRGLLQVRKSLQASDNQSGRETTK